MKIERATEVSAQLNPWEDGDPPRREWRRGEGLADASGRARETSEAAALLGEEAARDLHKTARFAVCQLINSGAAGPETCKLRSGTGRG